MIITSVSNEKIKYLKKLQLKKYRDEEDYFLVEGIDLVQAAFDSGFLEAVFALENTELNFNVPLTFVSKAVADKLSQLNTSDYIFGLCKKNNQNNLTAKILYLDNIQDPGNVGTIIRSALAFNIETIVFNNCCDLYNDKVIRASKGAIFYLNFVEDNDLKVLKNLEKDYQIIGTKKNSKDLLKNVVKDFKFVIIMGNEGKGISSEVANYCHQFIKIPINPLCESLNVAVATGIILYELERG